MRTIFAIAALLAALAPVAAAAQDSEARETETEFGTSMEEVRAELAKEFDQFSTLFAKVFATEPLTSAEEARLPVAERMTDHVFPTGSFAIAMKESMSPMTGAMASRVMDDPGVVVSGLTGVPIDELAQLDEGAVEEVLELLDPHHGARSERIGQAVITLMGDMFDAIEPAYREGLSRAFATRFEAEEMEQLIAFFQTDVGGKFARHSLLVQYDPQMMAMMEQLGPAMGEVMPRMLEEFFSIAQAYPDGRSYRDLEPAERARAALLLGRSEADLEALQPVEAPAGELDEMGLTT